MPWGQKNQYTEQKQCCNKLNKNFKSGPLLKNLLRLFKNKKFLKIRKKCTCVICCCCMSLFSTPWTVACQAPLSMGFSRQEYWSGFPCPSPGDLPDLGINPSSPTLQADSSPSEPWGKPKNTRVGSLSLLQVIVPTQESNQGLLHCRQILYQLSYRGSP